MSELGEPNWRDKEKAEQDTHYKEIDADGTVTPDNHHPMENLQHAVSVCGPTLAAEHPQTKYLYKAANEALNLANGKLAEQAAIIAKLREDKKGLIEALKDECSCMGEIDYSGRKIICACCEALEKYGDEK